MSSTVRIWDLPTRLFHWSLFASVVALMVTGKMGGDAMVWHFRLGYVVFALLLFRVLWGFVGGRWSRFVSFFPTPGRLMRYLGGRARLQDLAGHNPLGAFSVLALLLILAVQVASGLLSDDEIFFSGPLTALAPGSLVSAATRYHKGLGEVLIIAIVTLHLLAIAFYLFARRKNLVRPMLTGNKRLAETGDVPPSSDGPLNWLWALAVLAASSGVVYWVSGLGG
ncbi:MAG: cytochrome b/b6 domain-containing protein [Burkholderiaceae bacterium]|jgi:cytochrome b|nr:cytochrome b/b6 domain-containing protein [Burkholderiaceae bacterium]